MAGYIAVHVGAGDHSLSNHPVYKFWMKEACRKGQLILKEGGSAVDAVAAAIQELETCELTNTGYGSALTNKGTVECDAGIMDGGSLLHAGVGAVSGIKHPITVAHKLLALQSKPLLGNLVPPALLVGEGAVEWAAANGLQVCDEAKLVSAKSLERHRYYLRQLRKLKHKQKREKLALNEGAACKDGSRNSTCNGNARETAVNKPYAGAHPSNANDNVTHSRNTRLTNEASSVSLSHNCNVPEAACNGKSQAANTVIYTLANVDKMQEESSKTGDNFASNNAASKDSAGVEGLSIKSASCDSNMDTGDEPDPVESLSVHQGDSSSPMFKKNVKRRSELTRCEIENDLNQEKLSSVSEQNLKCQTNVDNRMFEESKNEPRNSDRDALLLKSTPKKGSEKLQQELLPLAHSLMAGPHHTKKPDSNENVDKKRMIDDSPSPSNRRSKRIKTKHCAAASSSFDSQTSNSPAVRKSLQSVLDTVGCVAVGADGTVAAGASSGGILLKTPGRVGQSALMGAGYWAENSCKDSRHNVAVCTSGCGEMLVSSHLAMNAAAAVAELAETDWEDLPGPLSALMLDSKFLRAYSRPKSSGCLILKHDPAEGSTDLYCCHTSISFGYAYMGVEDRKPTAVFSTMSPEQEGQDIIMNCVSYYPRAAAEPSLGKSENSQYSAMMPTWKILDPDYQAAEPSKTTPSLEEDLSLNRS